MATRSERIAAHIAAKIIKNTKRRFSTLHADALEELLMNSGNTNEQSGSPRDSRNTGNTSGMTVSSQVTVGLVKPVDRLTITGSTPGDFRAQANDVQMPPQPAPRSETATKGA